MGFRRRFPGGSSCARGEGIWRPVGATAAAEATNPSDFFTESGFAPSRAGDLLKKKFHLALGDDDRLYRYSDGVYVADGEQHARARLREFLGDKFKRRHLDEVIAWLRAEAPSIAARPPDELLNVRNGLLDWRTGELRPHSPEYPSAIQIPIEWNPNACCPQIEAFLRTCCPARRRSVDLVLEIIGYSLLASLPLHVAVLVLGPGRNGKSVLLAIIRALLGVGLAGHGCSFDVPGWGLEPARCHAPRPLPSNRWILLPFRSGFGL